MDFLPGLVVSRVGVLLPNLVNKLFVHFTFLFVSVYLFLLAYVTGVGTSRRTS